MYILIAAARCKGDHPRDASSAVEETTREEAEANWGQTLVLRTWKSPRQNKLIKSLFCLIGNELGFLQVGRTDKVPQLKVSTQ